MEESTEEVKQEWETKKKKIKLSPGTKSEVPLPIIINGREMDPFNPQYPFDPTWPYGFDPKWHDELARDDPTHRRWCGICRERFNLAKPDIKPSPESSPMLKAKLKPSPESSPKPRRDTESSDGKLMEEPTEEVKQKWEAEKKEIKKRGKARAEALLRKVKNNCKCDETFKKIEYILEDIRDMSLGIMKQDPEKGGCIADLLLNDLAPKLDNLAENPMNPQQKLLRKCHAKTHEFDFWNNVMSI